MLLVAWSPSLAPWPWQLGTCAGTVNPSADTLSGQQVSKAANCLCKWPECSSLCWFGLGVPLLPWSLQHPMPWVALCEHPAGVR